MTISIVAAVWNEYAKWLPEFCKYIAKSTVQPREVVICLGENHGVTDEVEAGCRAYVPQLKFVADENPNPNVGRLTNLAIENTDSEWIMPMDVDDLLLPGAIEYMSQYKTEADYFCIAWNVWHKGVKKYRQSPLPETIARMSPKKRSKVRINNNSPFRRKFWEKQAYDENNYMNLQFLAYMVEAGARFVKIPKPCVVYRQWDGSMFGSDEWYSIKPQARKANLDMYRRFEAYYKVKNG